MRPARDRGIPSSLLEPTSRKHSHFPFRFPPLTFLNSSAAPTHLAGGHKSARLRARARARTACSAIAVRMRSSSALCTLTYGLGAGTAWRPGGWRIRACTRPARGRSTRATTTLLVAPASTIRPRMHQTRRRSLPPASPRWQAPRTPRCAERAWPRTLSRAL